MKVLITGKDSYIGTSLERWLAQWPEAYQVDTLDMRGSWRSANFSGYDVVFHVAGIAHVSRKRRMEELYDAVNRALAIETAEKAKREGVRQFIFMSSIIIYGPDGPVGRPQVISRETLPNPQNAYGQSKLEADLAIQALADEAFATAVIRPPMIYGPGCKGNFPRLIRLASWCPVFPSLENQRSMLYIDNLCAFVRQLMDARSTGVFFPQNREYLSTCQIMRTLSGGLHRRMHFLSCFNPLIRGLSRVLPQLNRIWGNKVYGRELSGDFSYCVVDGEQSVLRSLQGVAAQRRDGK